VKEQTGIDWEAARARLEQIRSQLERTTTPAAKRERVFRQRAEMLAGSPVAARSTRLGAAIMVFRLGDQGYAVPLTQVSEVLTGIPLAPVPGAPPQVAGVIQVRGEIRPVFDLGTMLGLPGDSSSGMNTVVLCRYHGREAGVRVTAVEDVRTIAAQDRRPPPDSVLHVQWMTADLVAVLDMESLLEGDA
jgi:purine-binding chemotaxis protein CheW